MLKKFGMENVKPVCTPMAIGCKLSKDVESWKIDQSIYRSMIGGLLYLTTTRPNIMNAIYLVAIFQQDPRETHVVVIVKIIFRYSKRTKDYGLWYPKRSNFTMID